MEKEIFDELLGEFLLEAEERIGAVEQRMLTLDSGSVGDTATLLEEVRRELHTLKGNAGMMGLGELQRTSHELEDLVAEIDPDSPGVGPVLAGLDRCRELLRPLSGQAEGEEKAAIGASVRVLSGPLERLAELMGEQVTVWRRLEERLSAARSSGTGTAWRALEDEWRNQERILDAVRHEVLGLRMVPLHRLFEGLRRMARDEAVRCGKRLEVETAGEQTPLDRSLVEIAAEALGHLVRNAVVHGIETPEERRRQGKREIGTLLLRASISADRVLIEVIDDGGGVDPARLRKAAHRAGTEVVAEEELHSILFLPGVTTRESAGLEAGRGVGLSAVRDAAHRCGGDVEVASEHGVGSRFCLVLPATVATREVLMVEAGGERYALPVGAVAETVNAAQLAGEGGDWRGRALRIVDLEGFLAGDERPTARRFVAVLEVEGRLRGLGVDRFGDLEEVVVQGVDPLAARPGVAGATVLADGAAVLVLDPFELVSSGRTPVGEAR